MQVILGRSRRSRQIHAPEASTTIGAIHSVMETLQGRGSYQAGTEVIWSVVKCTVTKILCLNLFAWFQHLVRNLVRPPPDTIICVDPNILRRTPAIVSLIWLQSRVT